MARHLLTIGLCLLLVLSTYAQPTTMYRVNWAKDGAITAGGIGLTVVGSSLILNKQKLTEEDLLHVDKSQVNRFDRFAAGNYSHTAKKVSDVPFYGSFITPLFLLLDEDVRAEAPQVYLLYAQTMSITGGLFSMSAGLIKRYRPSVYATDAPLEARLHKYATNSFFGGHVAATASATFFAAKVFHDFNPDSPARPYVWTAAALTPAMVGYLRLRAGKHFLSDNLVGYALGAGIGILVPHLHKKTNRNGFSLAPSFAPTAWGETTQGANLSYTF
jgi:membrane-associated phospholipid phosphatase